MVRHILEGPRTAVRGPFNMLLRSAERVDPVRVLERKPRHDLGQQRSLSESLRQALIAQYRDHSGWSYQLHYENLEVLVEQDPSLGSMPSYASVRLLATKRSAIRRARYPGFLRNVAVALGNSNDPVAVPPLIEALAHEEPLVRAHAGWALGQLGDARAKKPLVSRLEHEEAQLGQDDPKSVRD